MLLRILLAFPILYIPNALYFSGESLIAGLNVINLAFLVLLVAVPLLAADGAPRLTGPGRLTPALLGLFLAYVLAFLIAQLTTPSDLMDDLTVLKTVIFYPLFYFVYRNCRLELQATRQLIMLMLVVAVVAGLDAVKEGIDQGMLEKYSPEMRASGPFGTDFMAANIAGYFYTMFLPMFVAMAMFLRRQTLLRLMALASCVVLGMAIMSTFSRQAYAIALLCLVLVALRRSLIIAGLIGLLMVAGVGLLPPGVSERVEATTQGDTYGGETLDASSASRLDVWTGALEMWRDHPAGVGLNRFRTHIGEYSAHGGLDAHNYYVLMLAEAGPLGLAALLWVLWRVSVLAREFLRSAAAMDAEAQALATGFSLLAIAMATGNLFGSFFNMGSVMASFWALCGLLERYSALKLAASSEAEHGTVDAGASPATAAGARFPLAARAIRQQDLPEAGDAR